MLDQLYLVYILFGGIVFLLFAHLSIWPVLFLISYLLLAYLFATKRNNSFAISDNQFWIINGRTPFVEIKSIHLAEISKVEIGTNKHPILDRLFIISSNTYVTLHLKDGHTFTWYTNVDFTKDAVDGEKTLEEMQGHLEKNGIVVSLVAETELYD